LEHAPRHANDALILAHCHAELYGGPIGVPAPVRGKRKNIATSSEADTMFV
jgi:hypothetical protein